MKITLFAFFAPALLVQQVWSQPTVAPTNESTGSPRGTNVASYNIQQSFELGYRFETTDHAIVVSGDTRAGDAVAAACNGCDVLVHEVYSAEKFKTRPPEWQAYHARAHTSTIELAQIATRARPKLLVMYHQLYWGTTDEGLLAEVRAAGYAGRLESAADLRTYR